MKITECFYCSAPSMFIDDSKKILCADCGAKSRADGSSIRLLCSLCNNPAACVGITVKIGKLGYEKTTYTNDPKCEECCTHDQHEMVPVLVSRKPLAIFDED